MNAWWIGGGVLIGVVIGAVGLASLLIWVLVNDWPRH